MDSYEPRNRRPERPTEQEQPPRRRENHPRQRQNRRSQPTRRRPLTEEEMRQRRQRRASRQQEQTGAQGAAPRRRKKKSRRKIAFGRMFDRRFGVRLLTALALVAAVILCCIVFFRVGKISVTGNETYSAEQILEASGIQEGDALLLINKTTASARIMAQLPYVDQVRIGSSFPNAVRIEVVELDTAYAVSAADGTYWLINSAGRVVEEITGKETADYLSIQGFQIQPTEPGQTIEASKQEPEAAPAEEPEEEQTAVPEDDSKPKERLAAALEILQCLESHNGGAGITLVDVDNLNDIRIWYGTQYQVNLGSSSDIAYKVEYMLAAIDQLNDYESGVLDLTFQEEKVARFIPWSN